MQHFAYLGLLIVSIMGIISYDMSHEKILVSIRKGILPIALSFILLLCADVIGISLNIFHTNPAFVSGAYIITPNIPIEEIFLLIMLPYLSLIFSDIFVRVAKKIS